MKIGILTFHASHNYGSMLQAYALQHYLNSCGHEVEIINLRTKVQKRFYSFPLRPVKGKLRSFANSLTYPVWLYHRCKQWFNYESFLNNHLQLTSREYSKWEDIVSELPDLGYQCIITGGDQIWNMSIKDFDKSFFLPSKLQGIRKIAYAPSAGRFLPSISDMQVSFIREHLSDYSRISVRESTMQEYLSQLSGKGVCVTVDPTLLLTKNEYNSLISEDPIIKGKYIYYYSPSRRWHEERNLAFLISQHLGMPIVNSLPAQIGNRGFILCPEAGPSEFLNLLKNATFVIGKSYHLVLFSLLFHKDFIAIDGESDTRIRDILHRFGIPERGRVTDKNYQTVVLPSIDFEKVDSIIEKERFFSQQFLENALSQ